ncbi:MAG: hypothetical protein SVZ03_15905 [Spirochaetota bacterium]|nr:hypothetical protein [Spirochaetota bacterium]
MPRCGDCGHVMVYGSSSMGVCKGILDEEGLGKEVDIFDDIKGCPKFVEQDRIRTNVSEFFSAYGANTRAARGFEEK